MKVFPIKFQQTAPEIVIQDNPYGSGGGGGYGAPAPAGYGAPAPAGYGAPPPPPSYAPPPQKFNVVPYSVNF